MPKRKITYEMLVEAEACRPATERFKQLFPNGVFPTLVLARKHYRDLDVGWAAEYLLPDDEQDVYYRLEYVAYNRYHAFKTKKYNALYRNREKFIRRFGESAFWTSGIEKKCYDEVRKAWNRYRRQRAEAFVRVWNCPDTSYWNGL